MTRGMMRWAGMCLILGTALALATGPAWAQTVQTGTVAGTVKMDSGETVAGAQVVLSGDRLVGATRTVVTNTSGRYVFLSVPPGTYDINVMLQGFSPAAALGVVAERGRTVESTITMSIGAIEDEIIVTGETPMVDTRSSTIDTTFSEELLNSIPTNRDPFYDLAVTAPGTASVGSDESWLPSPSAFGSATNENIFLVNGVNTTNPRGASWGSLVNVNYNMVEEVKVLALGSKAEYGSFSGAAIDVLTKSGGNQFHGNVTYFSKVGDFANNYTDTWGGDWLYADPADDLTTSVETNWEAGLTIGGPIAKDRLWFYAGYQRREVEVDTPIRVPLESTELDLFDVKLTADFGVNHRLWLGYHMEDQLQGNQTWGQDWDETMYYNQARDNQTLQFDYQWVVSDSSILGLKYLGFDTEQEPSPVGNVGHPGYINWWKWTGTNSIGLNGDFPYVEAEKSDRQTIQADFSHYAEDFAGEHDLKFGVQYTKAEGNWNGGYFHGYANFAYPYPWDYGPAANWWWNCEAEWCWGTPDDPVLPMYNRKTERNPWLTVRKSDSTSAFIDDSWIISERVTLNLGLRYDNMTASYGEGAVYEMPQTPADINNPTVLRTREGGDVFDFKTWSPRLGIAWVLTEDQKTVLRAHIGRYYAPLGVESLRRFGPDMMENLQETWRYDLPASVWDLNGNGLVDLDEVRAATRLLGDLDPTTLMSSNMDDPSWDLQVDPSTTSPYTDQFNISLQRQLGNDYSIEATFVYKKTDDILALKPYNSVTGEYYEWESSPFTTWTGYETEVWQVTMQDYNGDGTIDGADAAFVVDNNDYRAINLDEFNGKSIDRTYKGIQLVLNKRYSNRWQMFAALNWTDTDGFYPRPVDQNWYIDGPLIMDTPFGSTNNHFQNNTSGSALMTPEWMIKIAGNYTMPGIETDFGFRVRFDSGRAIFPIQSIPTYQTWMGGTPADNGVYLGTNWHEFMVADDPTQNDTMPSTTIIDLNLSKAISIGRAGEIWLSFDAFNVFNENSPNRVGYQQGDYGRVYSLVAPRNYRFGVKYSF